MGCYFSSKDTECFAQILKDVIKSKENWKVVETLWTKGHRSSDKEYFFNIQYLMGIEKIGKSLFLYSRLAIDHDFALNKL